MIKMSPATILSKLVTIAGEILEIRPLIRISKDIGRKIHDKKQEFEKEEK